MAQVDAGATPLVSVLVTTYNRSDFIEECLRSILASTSCDFEVVVVDDCSRDGSAAIAETLSREDSRIRVFRNTENLGDYPNRNRAASYASGKYLKYVDADDLIYPYALASMVSAMETFPDAALGLSWNVIDPPQPYPFSQSPAELYRAHYLGRSPLGVGPSAAIIRRDAFEAVGGFSGQQFVGDSELWLRLAAKWPVVSLPPALVWWRRHEGQQMVMEIERPEVAINRFRMGELFIHRTNLLSADERRSAIRRLRRHHARRLLSGSLDRPFAVARGIRASRLSFADLWRGLWGYS